MNTDDRPDWPRIGDVVRPIKPLEVRDGVTHWRQFVVDNLNMRLEAKILVDSGKWTIVARDA